MHKPVLLKEVTEFLAPRSGEFFIDGTLGDGGHAIAIIERLGEGGKLLAIDWDEEAIQNFKSEFQISKVKCNLVLVNDNFMNLSKIIKNKNLSKADGLLLDLGFSSRQLEVGRGFSFRHDEPLLMTYAKDAPALRDILKTLSENEIFEIIRNYGEERYARRIAKAIYETKRKKPLETSGELAEVVRNAVPKNYERGRIHPATRTFLAFRIYVNNELENLEKFLDSLEAAMAPGGRIGIISFNSLEDRIVKNMFKLMAQRNILKILTKKPVQASWEEVRVNPRARSAKFRAAVFNPS